MGCRELQVNDYFRMTDSVSGTDVPYYALADANKNITDYVDASGNIQGHYEYSPFGKITQSSGTMVSDFDYRFSSEVLDQETGLSYYNYRYYSGELGRWLSRDPVEERGGVNLYAIISNNIIVEWDRYGLSFMTQEMIKWETDGYTDKEKEYTGYTEKITGIQTIYDKCNVCCYKILTLNRYQTYDYFKYQKLVQAKYTRSRWWQVVQITVDAGITIGGIVSTPTGYGPIVAFIVGTAWHLAMEEAGWKRTVIGRATGNEKLWDGNTQIDYSTFETIKKKVGCDFPDIILGPTISPYNGGE